MAPAMNVLPKAVIERIQFCETHLPVWAQDPAAVGLTAAMVAELAAETAAARQAYDAAETARQASMAATHGLALAAEAMTGRVRGIVRTIKTFAQNQPGSQGAAVYSAAQIPAPSGPTPTPAPGQPTRVRVKLESAGGVTLSWEADSAAASSGAFFTIARRLPGQSGYTDIGGAPGTTARSRRMSFTDTTLPASAVAAGGATYTITGRRGDRVGPTSIAVSVQVGVGGAGAEGEQAIRRNGAKIGVRSAA